MDLIQLVTDGFSHALSLQNVLFVLLGVAVGTFIGMMPGIGSATGVAVLLPLTLGIEPLSALILLAGLYYGTQYGGSITSILLSTPGDAAQVVTAIDGYQLARSGRAGPALAVSAISSWFAGTATIPLLMLFTPALGGIALGFGPPELAALMLFGLVSASSLLSTDRPKALAAASVGVALSTVGLAPSTSLPRFTFGSNQLLTGVDFVPVIIGVFAIGEVLRQLNAGPVQPIRTNLRDMLPTMEDLRRSSMPTLRSSLLGFVIGVIPGAGATIASFFGYDVERRISKRRTQFGSGAIEGVAAPEAANNSAVNGSFVPTLTLGVPGSATTAVLLAALLLHGITPGPSLMAEQSTLVFALMASFFIGNFALLVLNLPLAPLFASILRVPYIYLYPIILLISLLGAYAFENNPFHVWMAAIFGIVGYLMRRTGYPVAPLVLGLLLGALMEPPLIQTFRMGYGDISPFLSRPLALTFLTLTILILLLPLVVSPIWRRRVQRKRAPSQST